MIYIVFIELSMIFSIYIVFIELSIIYSIYRNAKKSVREHFPHWFLDIINIDNNKYII